VARRHELRRLRGAGLVRCTVTGRGRRSRHLRRGWKREQQSGGGVDRLDTHETSTCDVDVLRSSHPAERSGVNSTSRKGSGPVDSRQHCKRYSRLTQVFSKKVENHVYAFALHTMYHNFVKISGARRMTPAQAAGVDSRLWEMTDIVKVIEDWERDNAGQ
jgi:hypothetical protein